MTAMLKFLRDTKAATAIEYGLIAALIAVACIGAMSALGNNLKTTFATTSSKIKEGNDASKTGGTPVS